MSSKGERQEKALIGVGISAGTAGLATATGVTVAGSGAIATEVTTILTSAVQAAPAVIKVSVIAGNAIAAAVPVVIPLVVAGGLVYALYQFIKSERAPG